MTYVNSILFFLTSIAILIAASSCASNNGEYNTIPNTPDCYQSLQTDSIHRLDACYNNNDSLVHLKLNGTFAMMGSCAQDDLKYSFIYYPNDTSKGDTLNLEKLSSLTFDCGLSEQKFDNIILSYPITIDPDSTFVFWQKDKLVPLNPRPQYIKNYPLGKYKIVVVDAEPTTQWELVASNTFIIQ